MRTAILLVCALMALPAQAPSRPDIDRALGAVYPSLVRISVVTANYGGGREIRSEASGSGTIVSADGYVITNHHVAGHARRIVCTLASQEEIPADLVGTDPLSDISVLKLRPETPRKFSFAGFAAEAAPARGETVLALGSPLALSQSVTMGIVSNPQMVMPRSLTAGPSLDGEDVGSIVRWIGHDAAIYPGNSGGPLINMKGEIVGVNELSFGLAAAIPADVVKPVFEAIVRHGRVLRASVGVDLQPRLNRDKHNGALVAWVEEGSPAATAGIESGDLLVSIGSTPIDVQFPEQLPLANQTIAALPIGRAVPMEIMRNGAAKTLTVTPVERTSATGEPVELRDWGIVASALTPSSAREMGRSSAKGTRVISVRAGGAAQQAKPPIDPDDVIVEVDGKPIADPAQLRAFTTSALASAERVSVLVAVERREERRLTIVDLVKPHTDEPPLEARKASLRVAVQVVTPALAQRLGIPGKTGVRVTRVIDPAIPLRIGDIILAVDADPVRASAPGDEQVFAAMLRQYPPGRDVPLTVYRDGTSVPITVTVQLAARSPGEMARYDVAEFGFRVRDLAERDREEPRLKGVKDGVMVESVEPGGWAALARLATGDVITAVDGQPVASLDALTQKLKAVAATKPASIVFRVRRGVRTLFVEIEPSWPK